MIRNWERTFIKAQLTINRGNSSVCMWGYWGETKSWKCAKMETVGELLKTYKDVWGHMKYHCNEEVNSYGADWKGV